MTATDRTITKELLTPLEAALLVLAAFLAASAVLRGSGSAPREPSLFAWVAGQVAPPLVLLAGAWWVARRSGPAAVSRRGWPVSLFAGGCLLVAFAAGAFLVAGTSPQDLAPLFSRAAATAWALLWVGVAAPAIEECYFRGVLQPALGTYTAPSGAVAVSALGFAVAHGNAVGFAFVLPLGLAFGAVRAFTGALLPAVLAHAGWNLGNITAGMAPLGQQPLALVAGLGLACCLSGAWFLWKGRGDAHTSC